VLWLLLAGGIVGLFLIINRTRKRSYRAYMSKADREDELKANDPDMKKQASQQPTANRSQPREEGD